MTSETFTVRIRAHGVWRMRLVAWAFPLVDRVAPRLAFWIAARVLHTCGTDVYRCGRWEPCSRLKASPRG